MMQNKYLFGITGGSGSGKSTVSGIFRSLGFEIIDCDILARQVTMPGEECLEKLKEEFGNNITDENNILLRKKLADIVFSDKDKLQRLNEITHYYILRRIFDIAKNSDSKIIGIDGAVLFESGVTKSCQKVIGVLASEEIRLRRIEERDKISEDAARARIGSQKEDKFYIEKCDFLVYNNGNKDDLEERVREVAEKLVEDEEEKRKATL